MGSRTWRWPTVRADEPTAAFRPSLLAFIGPFDLRVERGEVQLLPASSAYVVQGGPMPSSGPQSSVAGQGAPWAASGLSGELLAGVERQLAGEAKSASGYVLPVPDVGDQSRDPDASDDDQRTR